MKSKTIQANCSGGCGRVFLVKFDKDGLPDKPLCCPSCGSVRLSYCKPENPRLLKKLKELKVKKK